MGARKIDLVWVNWRLDGPELEDSWRLDGPELEDGVEEVVEVRVKKKKDGKVQMGLSH